MIKLFSVKVGRRSYRILSRANALSNVCICSGLTTKFTAGPCVLIALQEKQKKEAEAAASGKAVKQSAAELRMQKGGSRALRCTAVRRFAVFPPAQQPTRHLNLFSLFSVE
jgi:hypothetical protein